MEIKREKFISPGFILLIAATIILLILITIYEIHSFVEIILEIIMIAVFVVYSVKKWNDRQLENYKELLALEKEKRALEKHFELLFKNAHDVMFLLNQQNEIIETNERSAEVYGYSREELIGKNIVLIRNQEFFSSVNLDIKHGLTFEARHVKKDGTIFPVEISTSLFQIEGAEYVQEIIRDITERDKARSELIESEKKYKGLFDNMASGLALHEMIFDAEGNPVDYRFLDINTGFEELTGVKAENIINKTILQVLPKNEKIWIENYGKVVTTGNPVMFESYSQGLDKYFRVRAYKVGKNKFAAVLNDITENKKAELEREITLQLLKIINSTDDFHSLMKNAAGFFRAFSHCEAVGIRLNEGEDYPYYETEGFPEDFVLREKYLCARSADGIIKRDKNGNAILECMCGNVIQGRTNPAFPFFTEYGSFWSNGTSALLASTTDADRQAHTRNYCNKRGYESVALIPLRAAGETFGLIQLNDHRQNMFSFAGIKFYEALANNLSLGLSKKKADKLLAKSEKFYRLMAENVFDVVWIYNAGIENFTYVSPTVEKLRGFTVDEVLKQTMEEMTTAESYARIAKIIPARFEMLAKNKGIPLSFIDEFDQIHKNGSIVHTEVTSTYIINENNEMEILGVSRDITERKKSIEALRQSENTFRGLFNSVNEAIYIQNEEGVFLDVNEGAVKMYGYPREKFIGKNPAFISAPGLNDLERVGMAVKKAFAGEPQKFEYWGLRKNGEIFPKNVSLYRGEYFGKNVVIAVAQDVSERMEREKALKENLEELERFNNLTVGREIKMIELKKEINKLLLQSGAGEKYKIVE